MVGQRLHRLMMSGVLLVGVLLGASVATALEVGEPAPAFMLPATTGGNISLSRFQGQKLVLLEFYMGDFMPTCVANLSTRKADYSKFRELNVQILAISASYSTSQKALTDALDLPFPVLSDFPELQAIRSYGVLHTSPVMARRAFFLIDQQGVIRGQWFGEAEAVFPSEPILDKAREITGKR
ncbi:MAG TPA: redoxin domain-containing protein [Terriglobales bacterium]